MKNRPVTKVINLMKDMQAQLEKEADEDQEVYEKVTCWCETNDKDKTTSISDAEAHITDLTATIEEATASSARLNTEIKNLASEIAKNQAALDKATELRKKELAEFNAEEKDVLQSIGALKSAVTVLGKHNSFLQVNEETLINMAVKIQDVMRRHKHLVEKIASHHQRKEIAAFIQAPSDYFDAEPTSKQSFLQQPAGFQSYAPQSGAIFGILKQMKETFETNLSQSQKDEAQAADDFANLKAAKTTEMEKAQAMVDSKTQELADTVETNEAAKQNKVDTEAALAADTKFLEDLKVRCKNADAEFEERTKARAEELQAVAETIALLNSDEAHEMFGKTLGLLQLSSKARRTNSLRTKAAALLRKTAAKTGSQQLVALANLAKIAGFEKVKEAITTMVDELKVQQKDEVKHRDWCIEEFAENKKQTVLNQDTMEDLQAKIADLTDTI